MWETALVLYLLSALAQADESAVAISPRNCSLECIRQGRPACDYCRVTGDDLKEALGFNPKFGSCIPWPCLELLGDDPKICQHYVQAPDDVKIEFVLEPNPESDTIIVSWKPSYYGIAFLRGFQVTLQALGGSRVACQLFLFHRNISLPASHAQMVYKSDPFPSLSLGTQYAVTVMALPVPEEWEKFYHSKIFSTRTCAEKNGFEQCKQDWYPTYVEVQQEGTAITVTFNLAPPNLGIRSYFSLCYANGIKSYTDITPNSSKNKTHHSYQLSGLQEGTNYTCVIAANEVDAVRKTFNVHVKSIQKENSSATPSLAVVLPVSLVLVVILGLLLAALICWRPKLQKKILGLKPDFIWQHEQGVTQEEMVSLPGQKLTPPRLLICYSNHDGPSHVKSVMQLGAFIQQHMATQVCLDLWDSLSVAEEGYMAWHCRQIQESNFVLVICSPGLKQRPETPDPEGEDEEVLNLRSNAYSSEAVIQLIGEEVGRAKARGQDLSKYMSAIFEYSEETDIPTELRLVSHYTLMRDLPLLFSHLHGVALHRPGCYLKINHITEEGFVKVPAGAALQWAIHEVGLTMKAKMQHTAEGGD
ncbi:interleukin-17 receptor D [Melanotaenia boesemani]|uniref:interleukin-17 receptor D n=1 Tax=Melanotaenia boesemani TaxID=1250792 RepID=UPI001C042201|nr:interleukin-17 receptor D [Melanotaenia boesemani]